MANGNGDGSDMKVSKNIILTTTTLVPIGLAAVIVVTAFALKTWIDSQFATMSNDIRDLKYQMQMFETSMNAKTKDPWTSKDMRLWVSEFSRKNPGLVTPTVTEIIEGR